jgi:hypothetical protein
MVPSSMFWVWRHTRWIMTPITTVRTRSGADLERCAALARAV